MGFMSGVREVGRRGNDDGDYQSVRLASRVPIKHHAPP
jgi:hypothetical protein